MNPNDMPVGFLERTLTALNGASADLAADNADAARVAESRFESTLKSYIENGGKQYTFGGVHNLLLTIARIMEEKSQLEGDDFEVAAQAIEDAADKCDLKYAEAA
jgi:hypothetical protein